MRLFCLCECISLFGLFYRFKGLCHLFLALFRKVFSNILIMEKPQINGLFLSKTAKNMKRNFSEERTANNSRQWVITNSESWEAQAHIIPVLFFV